MEFINTPVKLELEEGDIKEEQEENSLLESNKGLTLKQALDAVYFANAPTSVNKDGNINEPVMGDNTRTYRPRCSKENSLQPHASSVQKVEGESDVAVKLEVKEQEQEENTLSETLKEEVNTPVVDDKRRRYRPRRSKEKSWQSHGSSVEDESDASSDDCRPRKRSRSRKKVTTMKLDEDESEDFKPRKSSIPRKMATTNKVVSAQSMKSKVNIRNIDSAIKSRPISTRPPPKTFVCDSCEYKAYKKAHISKHLLSHKKIFNFLCDMCEYKSTTKGQLARHIKTVHLKIRQFKCTLCTYAVSERFNLQRHVLNHHADSKEAESVKLIFAERKPRSKPKTLLCEICGYSTPHTSTMFRHKRRHEGVKRFICDVCSYETDENFKLKRHMKVHKGGTSETRSKIWMHYKKRNRPKEIQCGMCNYCTAHRSNLSEHKKKRHKELKPFSCEFCSYATSHSSMLESHLKKHHNKDGEGSVALEDAVEQPDMSKVTTPSSPVTHDQRHIKLETSHNNTE